MFKSTEEGRRLYAVALLLEFCKPARFPGQIAPPNFFVEWSLLQDYS